MRRLVFLLIIISSFTSYAQWSGRLEYVNFTKFHGQVFKPTAGLVVQYSKADKYDNLRYGATLGFRYYFTKENSIPYLEISNPINSTLIAIPSETVINKFYSFPLNIFLEYRFYDGKKLRPLLGLSPFIELNQVDYHEASKVVKGGSYGVGISQYIGASYLLNKKIEIVTRLTYEYTLRESTFYSYSKWLFSIGIIYYNY
jgi:hypothetical protein